MSKMDEIFKKQLQHRQESVPDHLWSGIEKRLHDVPKRRVLPMYAVASLAVVALLGIALYLMSGNKVDNTTAEVTTSHERDRSGIVNNAASYASSDGEVSADGSFELLVDDQSDLTGRTEQIFAASSSDVKKGSQATTLTTRTSGVAGEAEKEVVMDDAPDSEVPAAAVAFQERSKDFDEVEAVTEVTTVAQRLDDETGGSKSANTAGSIGQQAGIVDIESLSGLNNGIDAKGSTVTQPSTDGSAIQWVIEQTDNVTVNTISAPEIMKSEAFNRRRELYRVPEEIASIIELNTLATEGDILTSLKARATVAYTECPSFSKDHSGLFVDVYMSHDLPFRSLSARSAADQQLLDLRSDSESAQYSYGFGGRLSLRMPSGWSIRTGLHYTQVNELMSFVADDGGTQQFDNTYRMFDLPLLLGKDFGADGSRLYFSLNGGILLNMTFGQSATILDAVGMPVDAADAAVEQRSAYTDNAGLSFYVGGAAYYRLTDGIDVFAEPYMRYMPGNLTSDTYALEQQYSFVGINTGLRVRF
jgi:hypothetical protein